MNNEPGWNSLVCPLVAEVARDQQWKSAGRLKALLMTTFDALDCAHFVEHLLPTWCGTARRIGSDETAQTSFLLELIDALSRLEKAVIVSSQPWPSGASPYPWLWRYVRAAMVGFTGPAVQHAKLWMFVREVVDGDEQRKILEICISSANLTASAMRDQIQAAWRCVVQLGIESSANRQSWGVLPDFLSTLGDSCGPRRSTEIRWFAELLDHAACPEGMSFVASVPGTFDRQQLRKPAWGVTGLRGLMPDSAGRPKVSITAPTIGYWSPAALNSWLQTVGCLPEDMTLGWINKDVALHSGWDRGWSLPEVTVQNLHDAGVTIAGLCNHEGRSHPQLHDEHLPNDPRWLHAKLYGLSCGRQHRLLLTSANFTNAAWGRWIDDTLRIDNFELGVIIDQTRFPFELETIDAKDVYTCTDDSDEEYAIRIWAEAEWDGKLISVSFRSSIAEVAPSAIIVQWVQNGMVGQDAPALWTENGSLSWPENEKIPIELEIQMTDGGRLVVPVLDVRPFEVRSQAALPLVGIDELTQQRLREALLVERYNGSVASDDAFTSDNSIIGEDPSDTSAADYSVRAFGQYREWNAIIDEWQRQATRAMLDKFALSTIINDADGLIKYFERHASIHADEGCQVAARLAAEELQLRRGVLLQQARI